MNVSRFRNILAAAAVLLVLLLQGCTVPRAQVRRAQAVIRSAQPTATTCHRADHCARPSALLEEGAEAMAASTPSHPVHYVTLLPNGPDALAARINLIRAARRSIDVQTYIWKLDDAGKLMLNALVKAARRGVHVRIVADQLGSLNNIETLAALARTSPDLQIKLYNPTFHDAETSPLQYIAGIVCCFMKFNQRMHNKLLLVDNTVGITGGRNIENRYFGWDPHFDYIDRDVMVAGPAAHEMATGFQRFWDHPRSVPLTRLRDVNRRLLADGPSAPGWQTPRYTWPGRVARLAREASDRRWIENNLLDHTLQVSDVEFFYDLPSKTSEPDRRRANELTSHIMQLIRGARHRVLLQTPYLLMSSRAQRIFRDLHRRADPPQVLVSTNSLASTDAFEVYAISYKHRKRYLKNYGFTVYELKPFPRDGAGPSPPYNTLPPASTGAPGTEKAPVRRSFLARHLARRHEPLPLVTGGVRSALHAKSIVVDGRFAMVGSHNFDPRSDHLNTECGVIVYSRKFAAQVSREILRDTQPQNAWVLAPRRPKVPVLSEVNKALGDVSSHLPLFDFWPYRYATDYDIRSGCKPMLPSNPRFHQCYTSVGDFPEVNLSFKSIYTRLITAFGVGAQGIL